jgi:hypothetical protein
MEHVADDRVDVDGQVERLPHAPVGQRVGGALGHELDELQFGGVAR